MRDTWVRLALLASVLAIPTAGAPGSQAGSHSARSPRFTVDTRGGEVTVAIEPAGARSAGARLETFPGKDYGQVLAW
jgi:hypothetical protein